MENLVEYSDSVMQGTTWNGITIRVKEDGKPKDMSHTGVTVTWKEGAYDGDLQYIMEGDEIEYPDEVGVIRLLPLQISFPPGLYYGDVRFDTGGVIKTYLRILLTVNGTTHG